MMDKIEAQVCERLYILRKYIFSRFRFSEEDAEDIYGDTVLKIFQAIRKGNFKEGYSLDTYMRNCVWSVVIDRLRSRGVPKRVRTPEFENFFKMFTLGPEREYEARKECERFLDGLSELEGVQRKGVLLLLFQEMGHDEIAEILGIPRGTVSAHIHRARKRLGGVDLARARKRSLII